MGQLVADLARRARSVVIFCILDVPRINQGAFDGPMLAVNLLRLIRLSYANRLRSMVLSPSPIRALIDDGHYLQQLPIISLVMRTHFGPNTSYGSWQPVSVLLVVLVAPIQNPRDHALLDLCLISTSINCRNTVFGLSSENIRPSPAIARVMISLQELIFG